MENILRLGLEVDTWEGQLEVIFQFRASQPQLLSSPEIIPYSSRK